MPRLKIATRGENLVTLLWWVTARLVVTCLSPINQVNGLLIVPRSCVRHEMLQPGGSFLVRRIWT